MSVEQFFFESARLLAARGERNAAAQLLQVVRRMRQKERLIEAILTETDGVPVGVELTSGRGMFVAICEEPDGTGRGRAVRYAADGLYGHSVFASPAEALSDAIRDGYTERADGTLDRLALTPRWHSGMRYAELAAQYNAGAITLEELREQGRALSSLELQ